MKTSLKFAAVAAVFFSAGIFSVVGQTPLSAKKPLKQRIVDGEIVTGAFLGLFVGGPEAMFLAGQGLDFFIIDAEHYTFDDSDIREMITAARATGIAPIVRLGEPTQEVTRWLDAGAEGIIIPDVVEPQTAQALVKHGRYPPEGQRGASSVNGHTNFRSVADMKSFLEERNRNVMLIVMLEGPDGFAKLDEILDVPGIDGAIIGTGDYAQATGIPGQADHPSVWAAADKLIEACRERNMLVSVPIRKPQDVEAWMRKGLTMLTFVDGSMISQGIQLNLSQVRAVTEARGNQ